jgi:hypothetical protein
MTLDLERFCFSDAAMFLVPAEHLGPSGVSVAYAAAHARARGPRAEAERAMLDATLSLYSSRSASLASRAPESWMPPRRANLLVVTDPGRVRPYTAPFLGTSWVLYESDLDPSRASAEFSAYMLVHFERLALLGSLRAAVLFCASYWLERSDDEVDAFCRAASRSTRPDAAAFVALARALPWLRTLYHPSLRAPIDVDPRSLAHVEGAELLVPRALQSELSSLLRDFDSAARAAHALFESARPSVTASETSAAIDRLCAWLDDTRPDVTLAASRGAPLWDPSERHPKRALREGLDGLTPEAEQSLREDLATVDRVSRQSKSVFRELAALPRASHEVEHDGFVYLRADSLRVVYELEQSAFHPCREPAPPFHRRLLAARVAHEWGHLAHEAGWIRVAPARRAAYRAATDELARAYDEVVRALPDRVAAEAREELAAMGARDARDAGPALARATLARIGDWAANLFSRRICAPEELEAYVRVNVRHHLSEGLGPLQMLVRHAIEAQYLSLGGDADRLGYFFETSWFAPLFIDSAVFSRTSARAVFDATARACACYELDDARFRWGA